MSTTFLEIPRLSKLSTTAMKPAVEIIASDTGNVSFSAEELDSMHRDDAMTSAMVATILGCAFIVLLCLTIAVSVWTVMSA